MIKSVFTGFGLFGVTKSGPVRNWTGPDRGSAGNGWESKRYDVKYWLNCIRLEIFKLFQHRKAHNSTFGSEILPF